MKPIYSYLDFREFLLDYYNNMKENDNSFSYRSFSYSLGIKAPNFLQWIIEGKRYISIKKIAPVASVIGLNEDETQYFSVLVSFGQAKSISDKDKYFNRLLELRKPFTVSTLEEYQYDHFSNWYNEAIRVLLNMIDFHPHEHYSFRRLARMLRPKISESQARGAIKKLLSLGMAKKDEQGYIRQTERIISTGNEVRSFFIKRYHEGMIDLAKASMDNIPPEERDVSGITMNVSDSCFNLIKKEIQQTRKRILEMVDMDENPDNLYQLNVRLFPIAKKGEDDE